MHRLHHPVVGLEVRVLVEFRDVDISGERAADVGAIGLAVDAEVPPGGCAVEARVEADAVTIGVPVGRF
eukprot:scaffold16638_cov120-Isochrysis_galbana.AAC.2